MILRGVLLHKNMSLPLETLEPTKPSLPAFGHCPEGGVARAAPHPTLDLVSNSHCPTL